ncbi:MAG: HutD family protein [Gammaproteobacteria bacterium]
MTLRVVRFDDVPPAPWKNGGGVTRELLAWPEAVGWSLRVSVADVATSGPFSVFPGIDRWFGVLQGGGVILETAGTPLPVTVRAGDGLHAFIGDATTQCQLIDGLTRDFNVMAKRDELVVRVGGASENAVLATRAAFVACFVSGEAALSANQQAALTLPPLSLAWMSNDGAQSLHLALEGTVGQSWWIEADLATPGAGGR